MELDKKAFVRDGQSHSVWVVPASLCAISYINDPKYLPGHNCKFDFVELIQGRSMCVSRL